MKRFIELLANVRFGFMEICGTLATMFLVGYGAYKAYGDFIAPLFK